MCHNSSVSTKRMFLNTIALIIIKTVCCKVFKLMHKLRFSIFRFILTVINCMRVTYIFKPTAETIIDKLYSDP